MAQPDWLDRAASHGSTKWLKDFLRSLLPQLQDQVISPQDFALALDGELEGRRLMSPERQKNYRSNVCQALKELDAHHPAIVLVSPTADEYRAMNDAQRGKLAERETKFFTSGQAEALVERATGLLESREWSEVAAGLAVLMGRRISEILLSSFEVRSPWSLTFSEMAKKQGLEGLSIEIPTLAPAERVLAAIERLQRILMIEDLKAASLSPKMAKQRVNGRFSEAVASQCHSLFADLVPARTDRETLYTHLFRAVYATISAHWFCPLTVPEHLFKAEIQGHFTLSQEGRKLPNYSARANYDDYAIGTTEGNRDGRLGIKLGQLPGLQVIEAFRKSEVKSEAQQHQEQGEPMDMTTLSDGTRNALYARASNLVLASTWSEMAIGLEVLTGLQAERLHRAGVESVSSYVLRVDGEVVETLVQELQPTIARFQQVQPEANEAVLQAVLDRTFGDLVRLRRDDLPQVYAAILQARHQKEKERQPLEQQEQVALPTASASEQTLEQSIASQRVQARPQTKLKIRRPPLYEPDVEKLTALMLKRGVTGSLAEVFHAAIEVLESEQFQQQQAQTLGEVARTLNWFTGKVARLEATIERLQQERDQFRRERSALEDVEALRLENQRLEKELHQYRAAVVAIQNLPGRTGGDGTSSVQGGERAEALPAQSEQFGVSATLAQPRAGEGLPKAPRGETGERLPKPPKAETAEKINSILDELLKWNSAQEVDQRRLRISIPVIRPLASLLGASNQQAIQRVLEQRKEEVEGHHDQFGITPRHNAAVKDVHGILKTIAQEMGLENWENVRKPG